MPLLVAEANTLFSRALHIPQGRVSLGRDYAPIYPLPYYFRVSVQEPITVARDPTVFFLDHQPGKLLLEHSNERDLALSFVPGTVSVNNG